MRSKPQKVEKWKNTLKRAGKKREIGGENGVKSYFLKSKIQNFREFIAKMR